MGEGRVTKGRLLHHRVHERDRCKCAIAAVPGVVIVPTAAVRAKEAAAAQRAADNDQQDRGPSLKRHSGKDKSGMMQKMDAFTRVNVAYSLSSSEGVLFPW